jgi:hypothetical protein
VPYSFASYELLVYIVPGGLLLFFLMVMFPGIRALFGQEPVNVGGLVIFLFVAFAIGQWLQTASSFFIQAPMSCLGWAYRTNDVLWAKQGVISASDRNLLIEAVHGEFGVPKDSFQFDGPASVGDRAKLGELRRNWRGVIDHIYAKVHPDNLSDRLGSYSQHYSLSKSAVLTYLVMFAVMMTTFLLTGHQRNTASEATDNDRIVNMRIVRAPCWLQLLLLATSLAAAGISIERTSYFDRLFVDDLFWSYLHPNKAQTASSYEFD